MLDARECWELVELTKRYERLVAPSPFQRVVKEASSIVPAGVKDAAAGIENVISEQEIYEQALKLIGDGFKVLEGQAARFSVSEADVIKAINAVSMSANVKSVEEICRVRGYDVSKAANRQNIQHLLAATAEGCGTGVVGFAGIPFNLVLSTFLYYRAVQSIALSYGYDVKYDPAELVIASEVFANALGPLGEGGSGVSSNVAKFMAISAAQGVRQTAKKTWAAMVESGGPALVLAQMRALANAAARKALENAGQKGLENSVFREIFEQIGRRLTLKTIQRAVPFVSAGIGALIDTAQMNTVLQYADIFYHKRFLVEKEARVNRLFGIATFSVDSDSVMTKEPENGDLIVGDIDQNIAGAGKGKEAER